MLHNGRDVSVSRQHQYYFPGTLSPRASSPRASAHLIPLCNSRANAALALRLVCSFPLASMSSQASRGESTRRKATSSTSSSPTRAPSVPILRNRHLRGRIAYFLGTEKRKSQDI